MQPQLLPLDLPAPLPGIVPPERGRAGYWAIANYNWAGLVTSDSQSIWVSSNGKNKLYKADLDSRLTKSEYTLSANSSTAMGFVIDGNRAWVAHEENALTTSLVSEVNLDTGVVTDRTVVTKQRARGVVQDANYVYVGLGSVSTENCRVMRISKADGVTGVLDLGVSADIWFTLAVVGANLYVGLSNGEVKKVAIGTFSVAMTILASTSNDLRAVAKHPTNGKLYFAAYGADRVRSIDTSTDGWVDSWPTGSWPLGLAITPSGDYIYVHETYLNRYRAIKTADGMVAVGSTQLYPNAAQTGFGVPAMQPNGEYVHFHSNVGDKATGTGYINTITNGLP